MDLLAIQAPKPAPEAAPTTPPTTAPAPAPIPAPMATPIGPPMMPVSVPIPTPAAAPPTAPKPAPPAPPPLAPPPEYTTRLSGTTVILAVGIADTEYSESLSLYSNSMWVSVNPRIVFSGMTLTVFGRLVSLQHLIIAFSRRCLKSSLHFLAKINSNPCCLPFL